LVPADRNSHAKLERQREVVEAQIPERSRCRIQLIEHQKGRSNTA